jgi:hypothetical protein
MAVWTPPPKSLHEAKSLHANFAGCVTAGSDATKGDIEVSNAAPVHGQLVDENRPGRLRDGLNAGAKYHDPRRGLRKTAFGQPPEVAAFTCRVL